MCRIILCFAALCAFQVSASAESFFFKDGRIADGRVEKENDKEIRAVFADGRKETIKRKDLLRVLYHAQFKEKRYVNLLNGRVLEVYVVDEDGSSYIYRTELNSTAEFKIAKDEVDSISKRKAEPKNPAAGKPAAMDGIADLMYLPAAGRFHVEPGLRYKSYHHKGISNYDQTVTGADVLVGYGFANRCELALKQGYESEDKKTANSLKSKGLLDPEIIFKARANTGFPLVDLTLTYSPTLIDAKASAVGTTGSRGRGGQAFDGDLEIGSNGDAFSWALRFRGEYYADRKITLADSTSQTVKGGSKVKLLPRVQWCVFPSLYLRTGLIGVYTAQQVTTAGGVEKLKKEPIIGYGIPLSAVFAVVPGRALVEIGGWYILYREYKEHYADDTSRATIKDAHEMQVNISLRVQF